MATAAARASVMAKQNAKKKEEEQERELAELRKQGGSLDERQRKFLMESLGKTEEMRYIILMSEGAGS